MASNQTTNHLFDDPSIIQLSSGGGSTINQTSSTTNIHNLEPGSALSKLLDSAMANAAKESTPDLIPKSRSSTPPANNFNNNTTEYSSNEKAGSSLIYSVEFLLFLKDSPLIEEYKDSIELPDKSFWRFKPKGVSSTPSSSSINDFSNGNNKNKKSNSFNRRHQNETWERKSSNNTGFVKGGDLENFSSDKISQLLGEPLDELEPEWDAADSNTANSDSLGMMGQSVQDYEKWKLQMKLDERKRKGENITEEDLLREQQPVEEKGNDVDNFFSFVKTAKEENLESQPAASDNSRSSKFSSFFDAAPTSASTILPPGLSKQNQPTPQSQSQQRQDLIHSQQQQQQASGASRFFSQDQASSGPLPPQQHQVPPQQQQQQQQHQQQQQQSQSQQSQPQQQQQIPPMSIHIPPHSNIPPMNNGPNLGLGTLHGSNNNDSFFMALLNKKEPSASGTPTSGGGLAALFASQQESSASKNQEIINHSPDQSKVNPASPQVLMSHQSLNAPQSRQLPPQGPSQNQNQNQNQGQNQNQQHRQQQIPPWMKQQFQNRMPPGGFPPNMQFPPPPPNMQVGPGGPGPRGPGGPPPPGMFPGGMMPPPPGGIPPQFLNGNPNFIPPQFMGPPPPGMPLPPHLQHHQQQQHHQPPHTQQQKGN
ncbi:hypothetical protein DFJ63DRAFT_35937 [Scheffersomyces coipomensis]|uniref:uncharacterized protein n=1 Tax=Scheffersomyces coipomensis TaxID=1788519 RepID=UPI00315CE7E1